MGKYWENSFSFGGELKYKISNLSSVGSGIHVSYFSTKNTEKAIPSFYYLSIPLEIEFIYPLKNDLHLLVSGGIQSNTFLFPEEETEKLKGNDEESEFGFFGALGIEITLFSNVSLVFYSKYQTIFSSPEQIRILSIGTKFFFF